MDRARRRFKATRVGYTKFGAFLLCLMLFAACSSGGGATTTTAAPAPGETNPPETTPTETTPGETTPPPASGPVTVRLGIAPGPSVGIDPVLINDEAGLSLLGQTAEFLTFSDSELNLRPVLAESWESNDTLDVWTFNLNPAATYHDGTPVTAEDVAATFNGPISTGNAGSAYETYGFSAGNAEAIDEHTVQFTLNRPSGAFPFFVSSDNYNAVILPASFWDSYEAGSYEQSFIGSGPWINESYEPGVSATYVKNENYWGDNANQPDRLEVTFYENETALVTSFQGNALDIAYRVSFTSAETLAAAGNLTPSVPTAQHRQIYLDTSAPPFDDVRVRQAVAMSIDRDLYVEGLLGGYGVTGNDHPIWQFYPMFNDSATELRAYDPEGAKALLAEAGHPDGFSTRIDTLQFAEIENLATLLQSSLAAIGITAEVNVFDSDTYYQDYWCAWPYETDAGESIPCTPGAQGSIGIVNYGHRGVPDVYLGAPLITGGQWNASHWEGDGYDAMFEAFSGAPSLDAQIETGGQIQELLWNEVPIVVPYFIDFISATVPNFQGLEVTGMGHFNLVNAGFTD